MMRLKSVSVWWGKGENLPLFWRNTSQVEFTERTYAFGLWRLSVDVLFETTRNEGIEWLRQELKGEKRCI